jgi:hypothetical protein
MGNRVRIFIMTSEHDGKPYTTIEQIYCARRSILRTEFLSVEPGP